MHLPLGPLLRSLFGLGLLALLGGCAGRGTLDMCPDVRHDAGNVLRSQSPPR